MAKPRLQSAHLLRSRSVAPGAGPNFGILVHAACPPCPVCTHAANSFLEDTGGEVGGQSVSEMGNALRMPTFPSVAHGFGEKQGN